MSFGLEDEGTDSGDIPEPSLLDPSRWVIRFSHLVRSRGRVLDVAAGHGRHCQWFLDGEYSVVAIDRDLSSLRWLEHPQLRKYEADLEGADGWPLGDQTYDAVVVTNYLWRSIFDDIV